MTIALKRFDNRLKRFRALLLAFNVILFAIVAQAQQTSTQIRRKPRQRGPSRRTATVRSKTHSGRACQRDAIKIDGLLDEPAGRRPSPQPIFVRKLQPKAHLLLREPKCACFMTTKTSTWAFALLTPMRRKSTRADLVRDSLFATDDRIEIILDTITTGAMLFALRSTRLGTQQDALITDEGRDINLSWDGSWISAGRIDAKGYVVEIAIPLTTLRFTEGIDAWGFNVSRVIRRKNEENLWTSWQRSYGLERVSQAGELAAWKKSSAAGCMKFKPYVTGGWRQGVPIVGAPGFDAGLNGKVGLEVAKIGITPSLTAEFTANPDFGQAEVDNQIVNLTRFSVFFPEKRDFFLENSGIFLFGRRERIRLSSPGELV